MLEWDETANVTVFIDESNVETSRRWLVEKWRALIGGRDMRTVL